MLFVYRFGGRIANVVDCRLSLSRLSSSCFFSGQNQNVTKFYKQPIIKNNGNFIQLNSCVNSQQKQYFYSHFQKNQNVRGLLSFSIEEIFKPKRTLVPGSSSCFMTTKSNNRSKYDKKKSHIIASNRHKLKIQTEKYKGKLKDLVEDGEEASKRMLNKISNKVYTLPNILCMFRIGCTPVIGYLIVLEQTELALGLCAVSAVTDFLDGWIARNFNSESRLGALLDPLADKLLVATLVFALTYVHLIPLWLTALILLRDSLIILGGLYMHFRFIAPPITRAKFFDFTHFRSDRFKPTMISKINTGMQLSLVLISLSSPLFQQFFIDYHFLLTGLQFTTGVTTLFSGLNYLQRLG